MVRPPQFLYIQNTRSNQLTLDETLARLRGSAYVAGLALFGSRAGARHNAVSDYDVLVLLDAPPVNLFQCLTHIDGRMADIAFATVDDARQVLAKPEPDAWSTVQRLLMLKMGSAQIIADKSGLLAQLQRLARALAASNALTPPGDYAGRYGIWFWGNFVLAQVKRMARSEDPVYLTATDMLLLTALSGVTRDYFLMRSIAWEGEKVAIRHLAAHDPEFLRTLERCLACVDRGEKIALFEQLFARAIAPEGEVWGSGYAAIMPAEALNSPEVVATGLALWEGLIAGPSAA